MLGLASLRAAEEALRRWMNAAALVRPAGQGGSVVVVADAAQPAVQALIRWDPATFADRELAERAELRFPPAARMASVSGPPAAVASLLAATTLPPGAELLGPLPAGGRPAGAAAAGPRPALASPGDRAGPGIRPVSGAGSQVRGHGAGPGLRSGQAARSAAKEPGAVRVQLDPAELI